MLISVIIIMLTSLIITLLEHNRILSWSSWLLYLPFYLCCQIYSTLLNLNYHQVRISYIRVFIYDCSILITFYFIRKLQSFDSFRIRRNVLTIVLSSQTSSRSRTYSPRWRTYISISIHSDIRLLLRNCLVWYVWSDLMMMKSLAILSKNKFTYWIAYIWPHTCKLNLFYNKCIPFLNVSLILITIRSCIFTPLKFVILNIHSGVAEKMFRWKKS